MSKMSLLRMKSMDRRASLALVDSDAAWRRKVTAFFDRRPGYNWLGAHVSAGDLKRSLAGLNPDVLLTGLTHHGDQRLEVVRDLKMYWPTAPLLVLGVSTDAPFLAEALLAGARGYVLKRRLRRDLDTALQALLHGDTFISPEATPPLVRVFQVHCAAGVSLHQLTPIERLILPRILEGRTNKEIACELTRAEHTVAGHVSHILAKLGLHSRYELRERLLPWRTPTTPHPPPRAAALDGARRRSRQVADPRRRRPEGLEWPFCLTTHVQRPGREVDTTLLFID